MAQIIAHIDHTEVNSQDAVEDAINEINTELKKRGMNFSLRYGSGDEDPDEEIQYIFVVESGDDFNHKLAESLIKAEETREEQPVPTESGEPTS